MLLQLTRTGLTSNASGDVLAGARQELDRWHSIVLHEFIDQALLQTIQRQVLRESFRHHVNDDVGVELRLDSDAVSSGIEFLVNDPEIFRVTRAITACPEIRAFRGRIYRMLPGTGHASDWHDDVWGDRLVALSINLSARPFDGGDLQIREAEGHRIIRTLRNTGPGDAVMFRVDPRLEHQVVPVTGTEARDTFAGWFIGF